MKDGWTSIVALLEDNAPEPILLALVGHKRKRNTFVTTKKHSLRTIWSKYVTL